MAGWTFVKEDTSYSEEKGPVYSDPSGGGRKVRSEQYVASTTTYYKYYHRYGPDSKGNYVWGKDDQLKKGARHEISMTYQLDRNPTSFSSGNQYYKGPSCSHCGASNMWLSDGQKTEENKATRWYYQDPITVYYFKKDNLESTSEVKASDTITNVKKWVRYIIK